MRIQGGWSVGRLVSLFCTHYIVELKLLFIYIIYIIYINKELYLQMQSKEKRGVYFKLTNRPTDQAFCFSLGGQNVVIVFSWQVFGDFWRMFFTFAEINR